MLKNSSVNKSFISGKAIGDDFLSTVVRCCERFKVERNPRNRARERERKKLNEQEY